MAKCSVTGSRTLRGNNVPNSNKKTRKTIKNSTKDRKYYSVVLGSFVSIKCTNRADNTILKFGGIDCFVINSKPSKLSEDMLALRNSILSVMKKKNIASVGIEQIQMGL